jgi:hypothetical protein
MIIKRILVLANSTKHHPMRCVAGRELLEEMDGKNRWGGWIRPVSSHDEGALNTGERRLADAQDPRPLDVVQLPLEAPEDNALQPENWRIRQGEVWTKESVMDSRCLLTVVEQPESLWLEPAQKNDRASGDVLQSLPNHQSLYLIRPVAFRFLIRSRIWEGYAKRQLRGLFTYRGQHYDFALTDPLIGQKYFPDYPRTPEGYREPSDPRRILICVSLTPPFHDLHYKVIATVFELPE